MAAIFLHGGLSAETNRRLRSATAISSHVSQFVCGQSDQTLSNLKSSSKVEAGALVV